ncbi:MAG: DUF6475 domain-containing protein [Polynucleobacter sp.]
MNQNEKADFYRLISDVLGYWKQDVSEFAMQVWWNGCQQYSIEQVSKALSNHATDPERGQFAPKVADIVRILQGTKTDRSLIAWGKVHDAMSSVGAYQDVVFDDPAIHAAVQDIGGWPKICRTNMDELSYLQHRFTQSHKAYTEREQFDYPKRLSGDRSPDVEYQKKGLPLPKPAVVGDVDAARKVYLGGGSNISQISFQNLSMLLPNNKL